MELPPPKDPKYIIYELLLNTMDNYCEENNLNFFDLQGVLTCVAHALFRRCERLTEEEEDDDREGGSEPKYG